MNNRDERALIMVVAMTAIVRMGVVMVVGVSVRMTVIVRVIMGVIMVVVMVIVRHGHDRGDGARAHDEWMRWCGRPLRGSSLNTSDLMVTGTV